MIANRLLVCSFRIVRVCELPLPNDAVVLADNPIIDWNDPLFYLTLIVFPLLLYRQQTRQLPGRHHG